MRPDQGGAAAPTLQPRTVRDTRIRRGLGWAGFASASAAGAGCSAFVVWSYILSADEPFGLIVPAMMFGLSALGLLIIVSIVAYATKNDFGYFNLLAYLVIPGGWCVLVWRIPNAIIHDPRNSSYSQMAPVGGWTVAVSTFSIMCAVWVMGVQRNPWRIRIAMLIAVIAAHVPLVIWLLGLQPG
jgi:hypothetical protein